MEVNGTLHTKEHGLRGYNDIRVELRQKYGALKMTVDDERVWWNEVTTGDLRWKDVKFWLPSPWFSPQEDVDYFLKSPWSLANIEDVANIKNVYVDNITE